MKKFTSDISYYPYYWDNLNFKFSQNMWIYKIALRCMRNIQELLTLVNIYTNDLGRCIFVYKLLCFIYLIVIPHSLSKKKIQYEFNLYFHRDNRENVIILYAFWWKVKIQKVEKKKAINKNKTIFFLNCLHVVVGSPCLLFLLLYMILFTLLFVVHSHTATQMLM